MDARGDIEGSSWTYEAALNASAHASKLFRPRLLANVKEFFLGSQQGVSAKGGAIYAPDVERLFKLLKEVATVSGSRNRWALGAELHAPLSKAWIGRLATRYDQYRFAGRKDR